jgi:hypothetical protein
MLVIILAAWLITSCKSNSGNISESSDLSDSSVSISAQQDEFAASFDSLQKGIPVFYNMYLSVDMTKLFKVEGAVFTEEWLNPVDKVQNYVHSSKKALNLGIYAVDLSYLRAFEQLEKSRSWFNAMRKLSNELGIPDDYVVKTADRFDKNINNKDSLAKIATEIYRTTAKYLKENERESASSLIILGGWVEALYLASNVAIENSSDMELMEKIADQKGSLDDLIANLETYKNDPSVAKLLPKLQDLKVSFDQLKLNPKDSKTSLVQFKKLAARITTLRTDLAS